MEGKFHSTRIHQYGILHTVGSYRRECRLLLLSGLFIPLKPENSAEPAGYFRATVSLLKNFVQAERAQTVQLISHFLSFLFLIWTWKDQRLPFSFLTFFPFYSLFEPERIKGYPSLHCVLSLPSWCFVPKLCSSYINDKGLSQAMNSQGSNDSKSRKSFTMQKKVWWISLPYIFLFTLTISNEKESFPMNVVERAMKLGGLGSQANHNGAQDFTSLKESLQKSVKESLKEFLKESLELDLPKNLLKNLSKNLLKNLSENLSRNLLKNILKNLWKNLPKNLPENLSKNLSNNLSKNPSKNLSKNLPKNLSKNLLKNLSKSLSNGFVK